MHTYIYRFIAYMMISLGLGIIVLFGEIKLNYTISIVAYTLSSFLILYGYFFLKKSYSKRKGIGLNPRWLAKMGDIIFIISLSFAAYSALAWGIDTIFHTKIYLYDTEPMVLQVVAMFWLPSAAITAFFISNIDTQSIEIDRNGIIIQYPEGVKEIKWENLNRICLKDTKTIIGGEDWATSRRMQTKLSFITNDNMINIFEPSLKKTKKQIIQLLYNYAPDRLHDDITLIGKDW
ncbi:hypothetical protein DEFDS_0734 [Deferribacter desulfuricans SSM1]|uniref:Uncharacterized protein n=1 Tax=Deferribacter desulfuricans (strain DSM 14783 / JCM 11476 / NBRC 101012 / SSM1) TaxID=639282 RepID=D3PC90_DEFDS|nr:hypothetical protein [Deferribacter desulfuricans]BAI80213.1 hypothetical protein DEFDS_0734 [Deferribacter desulfuricans SSM1]